MAIPAALDRAPGPDDLPRGGSEAALPLEDGATRASSPRTQALLGRLGRLARSYDTSGERPLVGYAVLLAAYGVLAGLVAVLVRRAGERGRPGPADVAVGVVTVFRVTRLLTKDAVTAALRAPWTVYDGPGDPGEVNERPRRGPVRHAVGELVTCPFCLGQWVATAWLGALAAAPTTTRTAGRLAVVACGSDVLQHLWVRATRLSH